MLNSLQVVAPALLMAVCVMTWLGVWTAHNRGGSSGAWLPLLGLLASWMWFIDYHVDDALISYSYARNLADGLGPVAQPGGPWVEGFSNPLWVALLVPVEWSGLSATAGSKAMQLGLALASVWGLGWVVLQAGGSRLQAQFSRAALATSGAYVVWSASGLEVAQLAFLLLLTFALGQSGRVLLTGVLIGVCAWARPEGLAAGMAAGIAGLWLAERSWPQIALAVGVGLVPVAGLLGVRWWLFADVLPNTFYAKVGAPGIGHLWRGLTYTAWSALAVGLPLWAVGAGAVYRTPWRRPAIAAGSVLATGLALSVASGGDWMHHARFLAPYLPFLAIAFVPPAVALARQGRRLATSATVLAVLCGVGTLMHASRAPTLPMEPGERMARLYLAVSDARCSYGASVASADVGALLYNEPALEVIDLGGLVERDASKTPGGQGWPRTVASRRPAMVQLHGPWASRTGLTDEVLDQLGYRAICRRTPDDVTSPTLWLDRRCTDAHTEHSEQLLAHWCAHGAMGPWPDEPVRLFP